MKDQPTPPASTDETLSGDASKPASKNRRKLWRVLGFVSLLGIAATMWLPKIWVCTKPPNAHAGTDAAALAAAAEAFIIGHGMQIPISLQSVLQRLPVLFQVGRFG